MLITFEGIDASGKTTQLRLLEAALFKRNLDLLVTRQPGGTEIGREIRRILLDPRHQYMVPETEVLLYMADRIQHIRQCIQPALEQNKIVLCDRYHDATMAYQGGGRQLDLSWLEPLEEKYIIAPDLTLWFDISVTESITRLKLRNQIDSSQNCRLENEEVPFFERVRQTYRELCRKNARRFVCIDAEQTIDQVHRQVIDLLQPLIR